MTLSSIITVLTTVHAPIDKVWETWIRPEHIMQWNNASPDWHTPMAVSDFREGGTFSYRMEAKDGSVGFDFNGTFDHIVPNQLISYTIEDGRKVNVTFTDTGSVTQVSETFVAETENPIEMQKAGWQAILDSFKKYTESL